uniref:Protein kinase domain-containing protein n=1 Tax=Chromera velia CCMP2878 TaxID=1169474 RepID=A0A0G4HMZ4_9ALVE|eukprot:Cvel_7623.t1-p1 / transcript=Cvel_7623.t1 / gene=Cvel_7623 / organism=Chromera_velia_CCMP2878 / gene_product=Ankyrin repeat domain-containing protein 50, putative / transcript_product=Ankyrin repeat domain-containing protein 50, putative / location=Cvel_scaffold402:42431-54855(+) / protein_length=1258 / sequence_SO=supercontig / SO=protein_coding / is_pseudo=false
MRKSPCTLSEKLVGAGSARGARVTGGGSAESWNIGNFSQRAYEEESMHLEREAGVANAKSGGEPYGEGSGGRGGESLLVVDPDHAMTSMPLGTQRRQTEGQTGTDDGALLLGVTGGRRSAHVSVGWVLSAEARARAPTPANPSDIVADSSPGSDQSGRGFSDALLEQPQQGGERSGTVSAFLSRTDLPDDVTVVLLMKAISGLTKLKKLGQGGFGEVWEGELNGEAVAIKMISERRSQGQTMGTIVKQEKHRKHIAREVLALMKSVLEVDPHVCKFFGAYPARGCTLLVLELCQGDLTKLTRRGKRLSLDAARSITRTIAETLDRLHKKRIKHLDLKQANVLLKQLPTGDLDSEIETVCEGIRMSDFGLAQTQIADGFVVGTGGGGTPPYMAPEQLRGLNEKDDLTKVDVYALALLLWELLSGKRAWKGKSCEEIRVLVLNGDRPPLKDIPSEMRPLVSCMWRQNASERPTAEECAELLSLDPSLFSRASPELFSVEVDSGNSFHIKALLKLGLVDVNCRLNWPPLYDTAKMTAAHVAAFSGQVETLMVLADAGAELNAMDSHGRSPAECCSLFCYNSEKRMKFRRVLEALQGKAKKSNLGGATYLTHNERETLAAVPGLEVAEARFVRDGTWGPVFKGMLHRQPVAVERVQACSAQAVKEVSAMVSAMRKGVSHANIRKSFGSYTCPDAGSALLVLELCESVMTWLTDKGPVSVRAALSVACTIAGALAELHTHDMSHGALKLENVLVEGKIESQSALWGKFERLRALCNSIRLSGFGLTQSPLGPRRCGTPQYISPEQWGNGGVPTKKADVYALGFILWELLSGKRAWEGKSCEEIRVLVLNGDRPPLKAMEPRVADFMSRMWGQEAVTRPTAAEIAEEFNRSGEVVNASMSLRAGVSVREMLFDAVERSDSSAVAKLLASDRINVNCRGEGGRTPLHAAASRGHNTVVPILLEAGADPYMEDSYGRTPLNIAALNGHAEVVSILLDAGADKEKAEDGRTPLLEAAARGYDDIVYSLLQAGARVEKADKDGRTPLHAAAAGGYDAVVSALLKAGAAVDKADNDGRTPLHAAAAGGCNNVVSFPVFTYRFQPVGIVRSYDAVVSALLKAGADVDKADNLRKTSLCFAARDGRTSAVYILLQAGADKNKADKEGRTPLHVAASEDRDAVVPILHEAGADKDISNNFGRTPLHVAAERGHVDVVSILLWAGADKDRADNNRDTPLQIARQRGHKVVVTMLKRRKNWFFTLLSWCGRATQ